MSHACASQSIPIATAYDTLGAEGIKHSLVQTECEVMYIDPHLLPTLAGGPLEASSIKTVIINEECIFGAGHEIDDFRKSHPETKLITYQELLKLGRENPVEPVPAKGPDLYCVMYTSGSSGVPKGACITHQSLVAGGKCALHTVHCHSPLIITMSKSLAFSLASMNVSRPRNASSPTYL